KVRKVLAEAPAALALWTVAGSWSADNLTDGFVPDHQLPWLIPASAEELARTLVAARLWRRVRGGYQFHEWSKDGDGTRRNPTREEVKEDRRKKAEAGRKGGLTSGKRRSKREARAPANAVAGASGLVEPPTRPDPPPSLREGGSGAAPRRADARGADATAAPEHATNGHHQQGADPTDSWPTDHPDAIASEVEAAAERRRREQADLAARANRGAAAARAALTRKEPQ